MNTLEILDRPIAFHRPFVMLTGSVNAALMLSQAVYWSKRTKNEDGWFYKTQEEWEDETGLTRAEQETARKHLRAKGFWFEKREGIPAKLFYRICTKTLEKSLASLYAEIQHTRVLESSNLVSGNPADRNAEIQQSNTENIIDYTENTYRDSPLNPPTPPYKELTSHINQPEDSFANAQESPPLPPANKISKPKFNALEVSLPDCIPFDAWRCWVEHRREIRHILTKQSVKEQLNFLVACSQRGQPPSEIIEQSVRNGWRGLFELKGNQTNGTNRQTYQTASDRQRENIRGTIAFMQELADEAGIDFGAEQQIQTQVG